MERRATIHPDQKHASVGELLSVNPRPQTVRITDAPALNITQQSEKILPIKGGIDYSQSRSSVTTAGGVMGQYYNNADQRDIEIEKDRQNYKRLVEQQKSQQPKGVAIGKTD